MSWLKKSVEKQHSFIEELLLDSMNSLSDICANHWDQIDELNQQLKDFISNKTDHRCRLLYAIDLTGKQRSSNISTTMVDNTIIGQDLSNRPYLKSMFKNNLTQLSFSDVYIDQHTRKPCITVVHYVTQNGTTIGYIAADFGLKDLPLKMVSDEQSYKWRQIKGDPSIRGTLFQQTRTHSMMDEHLDEVLNVLESLMTEQGIFHAKLHFSSSRATLWPIHDPCRYRLHVLDESVNPTVCLIYEKTPYPKDALVNIDMIRKILHAFKLLREADETIYLRAASLNIMNGLVGLNFSCDGSHYIPAEEFLDKDMEFWFGASNN